MPDCQGKNLINERDDGENEQLRVEAGAAEV
jgi:hypothetical protein